MLFHTNQFGLGKRHWNLERSSAVVLLNSCLRTIIKIIHRILFIYIIFYISVLPFSVVCGLLVVRGTFSLGHDVFSPRITTGLR